MTNDAGQQHLTVEAIEEMLGKARRQMLDRAAEIEEKQATLVVVSDEGFLMVFHTGETSDQDELEELVTTAHLLKAERRTAPFSTPDIPEAAWAAETFTDTSSTTQMIDLERAAWKARWLGRIAYVITVGVWIALLSAAGRNVIIPAMAEAGIGGNIATIAALVTGGVLTLPAAFLIGPAVESAIARQYLRRH